MMNELPGADWILSPVAGSRGPFMGGLSVDLPTPSRRFVIAIPWKSKTCRRHMLFAFTPAYERLQNVQRRRDSLINRPRGGSRDAGYGTARGFGFPFHTKSRASSTQSGCSTSRLYVRGGACPAPLPGYRVNGGWMRTTLCNSPSGPAGVVGVGKRESSGWKVTSARVKKPWRSPLSSEPPSLS